MAAQGSETCSIDPAKVPPHPTLLDGTVIGEISIAQVKAVTRGVEKETGTRINPDYANLPRIVAKIVTSRGTYETMAAVTDGRIPHPGDHVDLVSRHRDPRSRREFIPWTIAPPVAVPVS